MKSTTENNHAIHLAMDMGSLQDTITSCLMGVIRQLSGCSDLENAKRGLRLRTLAHCALDLGQIF